MTALLTTGVLVLALVLSIGVALVSYRVIGDQTLDVEAARGAKPLYRFPEPWRDHASEGVWVGAVLLIVGLACLTLLLLRRGIAWWGGLGLVAACIACGVAAGFLARVLTYRTSGAPIGGIVYFVPGVLLILGFGAIATGVGAVGVVFRAGTPGKD